MIKTPSPSQTIHDAVRNFDIENLREFIASGKDVNQIDQHRRTPVHIAAWLANYDALLLLIRSKAITNSKAMDGSYLVFYY
jgi:ankyrin repeat protein